MNCNNCGAWNSDDALYCSQCGSALNTTKPVGTANGINVFGLISSVVLLASAFLPLFSVNVFGTKVNASLIDGTDWIIIVLLAVAGVWFAIKERGVELIICGVLGFAYFLYVTYSVKNSLSASAAGSELAATIARSMVERGLGYFALLFGSVGLTVAGIISIKK